MADVYYIPDGPKNLASLFPQVDWNNVESYTVSVIDGAGTTIATTPLNVIDDCCETIRIHFLNYLGTIDALDFKLVSKTHEAKSSSFQSPVFIPLIKSQHQRSRTAVTTSDNQISSNTHYGEDAQTWLDELIDSPLAWIEWKGTQGQPDGYLPVVIVDMKKDSIKEEERYSYELRIEFGISAPRVIIRN